MRTRWAYLSAPLPVYLTVMVPICGLQVFLLLMKTPAWMRWSSGIVVALSIVYLAWGYGRRLVLDERGAQFRGLLGRVDIPWPQVRRVGVYVPGGGVGVTEYTYITTREDPPLGKWDQGPEVIQLQNRDGLVDAIERARSAAVARSDDHNPTDSNTT